MGQWVITPVDCPDGVHSPTDIGVYVSIYIYMYICTRESLNGTIALRVVHIQEIVVL